MVLSFGNSFVIELSTVVRSTPVAPFATSHTVMVTSLTSGGATRLSFMVDGSETHRPLALVTVHVMKTLAGGRGNCFTLVKGSALSAKDMDGSPVLHVPVAPYAGASACSITVSAQIKEISAPASATGLRSVCMVIDVSTAGHTLVACGTATSFTRIGVPAV